MKVARRPHRDDTTVNTDFVYLRFSDGLIVDPRACPIGVLVHPHWRRVDGLEVAGEPNAECACNQTAVA